LQDSPKAGRWKRVFASFRLFLLPPDVVNRRLKLGRVLGYLIVNRLLRASDRLGDLLLRVAGKPKLEVLRRVLGGKFISLGF
jgi:hypothetical protein